MKGLMIAAFTVLIAGTRLPAADVPVAQPVARPLTLEERVLAKGALLVDVGSGRVLFEKNTETPCMPASTTKMLTALVAYERCGLDEVIKVRPEATRVEPSHVPLVVGDRLSMRDALNALLIGSDNDVAVAIAQHVAGDVESFVALMNKRAAQLGCVSSRFQNPNGLTAPGQYTTCEDLLKIFRKTISYPFLRQVMRTPLFILKTQTGTHRVKNHNLLLGKYPGMGPAKTGWTSASRHTYAASASENGRELHLILLNSENKWKDARLLFDTGFGRPTVPARRTASTNNDDK
jgi:D-alanyl-D-alanine carboxypeptidase